MIRSRSARVALALLLGPALPPGHTVHAQDLAAVQTLADRWCAATLAFDEDAALALMSADLQSAVATLRVVNDAFIAANPGEKPPLGNGLPLTAYQDAAQSCTISDLGPTGARLTYVAASDPSANWTDHLIVGPDATGHLAVTDLLYAPDQSQSLSAALEQMAQE